MDIEITPGKRAFYAQSNTGAAPKAAELRNPQVVKCKNSERTEAVFPGKRCTG
ncbi:hypothetical protein M0G74_14620 [Microbulbifer sp. CAU 1566]|uniref:hypothetical protein n=1 Tax=Microbulbifer sp. CAU 1566 TaxID=2933269 RepID=UPI002003F4DE|nr:hypothetical protein [Microbulbifer sp. CAU 1566]MCK7598512.1 hypothetical protein [Microbulbifer sp. CAU 1566]